MAAPLTWSLPPEKFAAYLARQADAFFPDGNAVSEKALSAALEAVTDRYVRIATVGRSKYFRDEHGLLLDHLNSDQSTILLYLLSNHLGKIGDTAAAVKLYLLNKALNGVEAYYAVELPDIFTFSHSMGSVLGRADYGNYLVVSQSCTVGNVRAKYPRFGEGTILFAGATVLGDCQVGDNVCFGAGCLVVNKNIPSNSVVIGRGREVKILPAVPGRWKDFFHFPDEP